MLSSHAFRSMTPGRMISARPYVSPTYVSKTNLVTNSRRLLPRVAGTNTQTFIPWCPWMTPVKESTDGQADNSAPMACRPNVVKPELVARHVGNVSLFSLSKRCQFRIRVRVVNCCNSCRSRSSILPLTLLLAQTPFTPRPSPFRSTFRRNSTLLSPNSEVPAFRCLLVEEAFRNSTRSPKSEICCLCKVRNLRTCGTN